MLKKPTFYKKLESRDLRVHSEQDEISIGQLEVSSTRFYSVDLFKLPDSYRGFVIHFVIHFVLLLKLNMTYESWQFKTEF